jgi:hypothetical protein
LFCHLDTKLDACQRLRFQHPGTRNKGIHPKVFAVDYPEDPQQTVNMAAQSR